MAIGIPLGSFSIVISSNFNRGQNFRHSGAHLGNANSQNRICFAPMVLVRKIKGGEEIKYDSGLG